MDSDDWYELNYLELMFKEICKTKAEIVFCDFFDVLKVVLEMDWKLIKC